MWNLKILTALMVLAVALCGSGAASAFDAKHLMKLKALNACEGCDLSDIDLSGAKLRNANLRVADLSGADLSTAILKNAHLNGAILCKTLMPWGEENAGCKDAKPIVEAPKTEKRAAKYKVCKKTCADYFMVCIVDKPNIRPEACTETANQCLYTCKDKFQ